MKQFIKKRQKESFLSLIDDYYDNMKNYKNIENYFIHISKNTYTIDKMKRSFSDLGEKSRQFIINFDHDLTDMEDHLNLVNFQEVLEMVKDRESILSQKRHLIEGTQWLPEFQRRIKTLIPARKALGNLEEPVRVSKERLKELEEHRKKHFTNLPKYEEPEEIKDWDW